MIQGAINSYDKCKVLGKFGTNYTASQPTDDRGRNPIPRKIFHKKQENHAIIINVVDEIQIIEPKKVSAVHNEAPELLESDYDENELYQVENMSLNGTKEKLNEKSVDLYTKVHM